MKPRDTPIGLLLAQTAKTVSRAFDDALVETGGSLPTWLILMSLMRGRDMTHGALAERVGVRGPTLTHHLDGMERDGLVRRERDAENRRVQKVSLTDEGVALFHRLRKAAVEHDARLRRDLTEEDVETMRALLRRMQGNVGALRENLKGDRP